MNCFVVVDAEVCSCLRVLRRLRRVTEAVVGVNDEGDDVFALGWAVRQL